MKINKLKINAYGKLKEKELNFENNINIIYGKNEAGKSTILNFITSCFYGISKNKNGKEISNFEKYTPWVGEEFSGKLEYELDNQKKFEVYRDFRKKNPKIFNEEMEDISKEFNIDKNRGNEFFYEQTKVDEPLFLSTILVNQQEVKLEKQEQNVLIQKIANLVGTGDDNVSFKRAIDRIDRRRLDEIGTGRSREKPINLIGKKIAELEEEERLEKEKGNTKEEIPIENKDMDKVLEEFKFDLYDAMKENNITEEKQTANEANVAKTFNDILMENSNKEDIKLKIIQSINITIYFFNISLLLVFFLLMII